MDIKTPEDTFREIAYADPDFDDLLEHLSAGSDKPEHHLCLFLGLYQPHKKKALKRLKRKLNRSAEIVDTAALVTRSEQESYENLDRFFEGMDRKDTILYFKNGDKLCGAYTNYSKSAVKYATPQERHFLEKVRNFEGLVIVDIEEFSDADKTLRRAARSIVTFKLPKSKLMRFFWHLRNFSPHGFVLKTKRPEAYDEKKEIHF